MLLTSLEAGLGLTNSTPTDRFKKHLPIAKLEVKCERAEKSELSRGSLTAAAVDHVTRFIFYCSHAFN